VAASEPSGAQDLDERLMPAGTGARFALVVILALVTSAKMILEFSFSITGQRMPECELAAGIDVFRSNPDASVLLARLTQYAAYTNCEARIAPPPPWWLPAGWPLLVLVAAVLFFYADRWWKLRAARMRPLREFDGQGNGIFVSGKVQRAALDAGLARETGEAVARRCVVDVTSAARSATVMGSTRRPVLCLHLGLVARRLEHAAEGTDDPEFRAVLLHEFAHIRYGDVTAARATMAVWRAFLAVALAPYLVITLILLRHGTIAGLSGYSLADQRDLATTLVLVCLGYLARMDVLRHREIYADREAIRNKADPGCWPARERPVCGRWFSSWPRRAVRAVAESLRSHPRWDLRTESLDDASALFVVQALPMFLTGAAAALIASDFLLVFQVYGQKPSWFEAAWTGQAIGALSAALVTLVAGVALWRSVAYGQERRPPAPTGLGAGLWLGAGMVAGDLVAGQGTINHLVPARPEVYLLVLAAGAGFGWWTAQCAGAWLAGRQSRTRRTTMTAGLAAGFLMLSWWFTYWAYAGIEYAAGFNFSSSGWQRYLEYQYGVPVAHPQVITAVGWTAPPLNPLKEPPVDLLAVGAAWLVPLMAWTLRRAASPAGGLPSLRTPLRWAASGAVAIWASSAVAQAYMHQAQPARPLHGIYEVTYVWLLFAAQALPAAAVALIVGLGRGRFRLLVTLIAVEAALLAGFAGTFLLISADGCIRPLATLETSCAWRPGLAEWGYGTFVDLPALLGAALAFAVCGLALIRPAVRKDRHADPDDPTVSYNAKERAVLRWPSARSMPVLAGTAALGVVLTGIVLEFPGQAGYPSESAIASGQLVFQMTRSAAQSAAPPPQVAALEVEYWSDLGGAALLSRLQSDAAKISPVLAADFARQHRYTVQDFHAIEPVCADIVAVSQESSTYLLLPDARAAPWWSGFAQLAGTGGRGCESAIALLARDHFSTAFWTVLNRGIQQIGEAYVNTGFIAARIEALEEAGGITRYGNGIAGPPLNVLPPPAGTRRWSRTGNTGNPMNLAVAVAKLYPASDWSSEETWLSRHGFVSTAREGWTYADGTQAAVIINRFAAATDAASQIGSWDAHFRQESAPAPALTDPADGGMGVAIPASKQTPDVKTEMATHLGSYVIEVQVYARTPAPALAKALLRQQYARLKAGGA